MSRFQILDEKRYPLKTIDGNDTAIMPAGWAGKNHYKDLLPYWRWEHRVTLGVTIGLKIREFMVFVDQLKQSIHIEEISGGHLEQVLDEVLFDALLKFADEKGYCNMLPPLMKQSWERFL